MSRYGRRRRKSGKNAVVSLTLISLMDIFTILLLFLLVHAGDDGIALPATDQLSLPASTSKTMPESTVTLMVTEKDILVEGRRVMAVAEALKENALILPPVKKELVRLAERTKELAQLNASVKFTGKITVMGDKKIPFRLLKKIMSTAARAAYPNIALGVMQKEQGT